MNLQLHSISPPSRLRHLFWCTHRPTDRSSTDPPTRAPPIHRIPKTDHRPADKYSTDPLSTDSWPTDKCSTDPQSTDNQPTDKCSTDPQTGPPPTTDNQPPTHLCKTYLQHVEFLQICTYLYFNTNAHSLSIHMYWIRVIISHCQDILFMRMIQFRWRCNIYMKP